VSTLSIPGLELKHRLGVGAHSSVYLAVRDEQRYAVKVVRGDAIQMVRLRREGSLLARVRHPSLPRILDVGEVDGMHYLVMEHVDGRTLAANLCETSRLPPDEVLRIARDLASVLAAVHEQGIVHCDLKPANILLPADQGPVRLIDFGFALQEQLTRASDTVAGTFLYMAPEQSGVLKRPVDGRADLYALGAVLFECATGAPPFSATDDIGELLRQHAVVLPKRVDDLVPGFPRAFAAIVAKLLAKDPDDRYVGARQLLGDLGRQTSLEATIAVGGHAVLGSSQETVVRERKLVGRDAELRSLRDAFAKAEARRGATVLVEGEPGAGKSRLVAELFRDLGARGALVFSAKCKKTDATPLLPLRNAIDDLVRGIDRLPVHERAAVAGGLCCGVTGWRLPP
jgi:serine/threonine protein kinase